MEGEPFVKCKIWRGGSWLFEDERFVEIVIGSKTYKTIADRRSVREHGTLREDNCVEGLLRVYQVKKRGEDALVILPQEVMGRGRRLRIPQNLLVYG